MVRRVVSAGGAVAAASVIAGCGSEFPIACTEIGWFNTITVPVEGDTSALANLHVCVADSCRPIGEGLAPSGEGRTGDTFVIQIGMTEPERMTVRAVTADGTVLREAALALDWVFGGVEPGGLGCGGPSHATAVLEL